MDPKRRFVDQKECSRITGLSHVSIRKYEKEGNFPKRHIMPGQRKQIGWLWTDIDEWVKKRNLIIDKMSRSLGRKVSMKYQWLNNFDW